VEAFIERSSERSVLVRTPQPSQLAKELERSDGHVTITATPEDEGVLIVRGIDAAEIGEKASAARVVLHELTPQRASLEEAFMEMTRDSVEYHASSGDSGGSGEPLDLVPPQAQAPESAESTEEAAR